MGPMFWACIVRSGATPVQSSRAGGPPSCQSSVDYSRACTKRRRSSRARAANSLRRGSCPCRAQSAVFAHIVACADHIADELLRIRPGGRFLGDFTPAMHNDEAIGDGESVGQDMGDQDHRHATLTQPADEIEHFALLGNAKI